MPSPITIALLHSLRNELRRPKPFTGKVILINPSNIYSHFNLGIVNYKMELYNEADDNFTAALQLFPGFVGAMVNRSLVRKAMNKMQLPKPITAQAMALIQKMNQNEDNPANLFRSMPIQHISTKLLPSKPTLSTATAFCNDLSFAKLTSSPFGNITIAFARQNTQQKANSAETIFNLQLSQLNAELPEGLRLAYQFKLPTDETFDLQQQEKLIEATTLTYSQKQLILGALNQERNNLSRAIEYYANIPLADSLAAFALLNQAVAHFNKRRESAPWKQNMWRRSPSKRSP